jgi:tetratricopeptide (TPR) repeat protein
LRIKSVLHGPNGLAYFLILITGLTFFKLSQTTIMWQRGLWGAYLAMVLVTAILTQSRGGLLGLFTTVVVFVALLAWSRVGKVLSEKRVTLAKGALGALLLVLAFTLLVPVVLRTDLGSKSTLALRNEIWEGARRIFLANPILGAGPNTFPTQYMAYRSHAQFDVIYATAHNVWLTIAAEYGIVGLLVIGYLCFTLGRILLSYFIQVKPNQWSGTLLAGVSILAGQGVHNLVDDFIDYLPAFTWFAVVGIVLCLLPISARYPPLSTRKRQIWLVLVAAALLITLGSSLYYARAFAAYERARQSAQADDWPQAVRELERAVDLDPTYRFYRQQLALAYGELARTDGSYLPLALTQQKLVYDQNDSYPPDVAYLACLYWQSDQPESALELMHKATSVAPPRFHSYFTYHLGRVTFFFNLGHYLESMGETDLAQQAYAQILLAFPQLGTSPYWQTSEARRQNLQASARVARQLADDEQLAAEIAFYSGDYRAALDLFAAPPVDQIGRAKSLLALGQVEDAARLLATDRPQSVRSLPLQAQVFMSNGDLGRAESTLRQAVVRSYEDSSMLLEEPSYYYRWGYLAELQGNISLAKKNYERAITLSTAIQTIYANLVWNRQPMPTEQPFCLMIPYPADNLSEPSLALADLMLAQNDLLGATSIYRNLLRHEPYNLEAQRKFRELSTTYPTLQPGSPADASQ